LRQRRPDSHGKKRNGSSLHQRKRNQKKRRQSTGTVLIIRSIKHQKRGGGERNVLTSKQASIRFVIPEKKKDSQTFSKLGGGRVRAIRPRGHYSKKTPLLNKREGKEVREVEINKPTRGGGWGGKEKLEVGNIFHPENKKKEITKEKKEKTEDPFQKHPRKDGEKRVESFYHEEGEKKGSEGAGGKEGFVNGFGSSMGGDFITEGGTSAGGGETYPLKGRRGGKKPSKTMPYKIQKKTEIWETGEKSPTAQLLPYPNRLKKEEGFVSRNSGDFNKKKKFIF